MDKTQKHNKASSSPPKPKPKKSQKTAPMTSSIKFNDIWKLVASSQYLTTSELGRLLLLTSKSFTKDDQTVVWKLLCHNQWGEAAANALLEATQMDPKDYFTSFACPPKQQNPYTVPPLKYAPKDYILIVEIRLQPSNELLICRAIKGETIPEFFAKGELLCKMEDPILNYFSFNKSFASFEEFQRETGPSWSTVPADWGWKGKVHVFRKPDQKSIELLDVEKFVCSCQLRTSNEDNLADHYILEDTAQGSYSSGVSGHLGMIEPLEHLDFYDREEGMDTELLLQYNVDLGSSGSDTASLSLRGFHLKVSIDYGGGNVGPIGDALKKKGMEFAHVLEALPEWDE